MTGASCAAVVLALGGAALWAQDAVTLARLVHQEPDPDGAYYTGPEVTAPRMISTVLALYPSEHTNREVQGMTVLATLIDAKGLPQQIQILHSHGDAFDQSAIAALQHTTFRPGSLGDRPVPVWIDVRVVFYADHSSAIPQVLITERDLAPPEESRLENKHHNPLASTPPFPIHTVDADFVDPFAKHPYVQVAVVSVLVSEAGMPAEVRVSRGLGFGLDEKAAAAVRQYRFMPATNKGHPVAARTDLLVSFTKF